MTGAALDVGRGARSASERSAQDDAGSQPAIGQSAHQIGLMSRLRARPEDVRQRDFGIGSSQGRVDVAEALAGSQDAHG